MFRPSAILVFTAVHISVGIATKLWAGRQTDRGSIHGSRKKFVLNQNYQAGSEGPFSLLFSGYLGIFPRQ
jgi:hypothetical protein